MLPRRRIGAVDGTIDTVVVALRRHVRSARGQARGRGEYFLEHADHGVDVCSSPDHPRHGIGHHSGLRGREHRHGYGDFALRLDLAACGDPLARGDGARARRPQRWHDGTPVNPAPRAVLRAQVERARALGFEPAFGSEVEFFVCRETYDEAHAAPTRARQGRRGT